jgi:acyl-coenzyme A synthetase/AMP-(fatty) acid ligase
MPRGDAISLRTLLGSESDLTGCHLWATDGHVALRDQIGGSSLGGRLDELRGRSVLVATGDQFTTALALIELDGVARRLVLCPPDLKAEHLPHVIATADVDAIVSNRDAAEFASCHVSLIVGCTPVLTPSAPAPAAQCTTEWIMLTSGTTGVPKMVVHTLAGLISAIDLGGGRDASVVWSTFYDIRRYGGLQIFFRGLLCGSALVLSSAHEPIADQLMRLGTHGVTHISGTPSHWRRAIMSPAARAIAPRYVRLSGEIADQAVLDSLRAFFPQAKIAHAYASTEAGVGFDVEDGRVGFPASYVGAPDRKVEMALGDGSLRIRSPGTALRYLGADSAALHDHEGFVETGDLLELRGDRYYFVGRRGGIINVGGLKVHPEEVEAIINRHPDVRMSLVRARKNAITGAIVVADVVLRGQTHTSETPERAADVKREIMQACRDALAEHKVPAAIRVVPALDVGASGKLARHA